MSISEQDQQELRELRIRQAEEAWVRFFKKHKDVMDTQANRLMFADRFIVRHPKTGEYLGETIPTLQTLEDAFETLKGSLSYVEEERPEPAPEPPSQSEIVAEWNQRLIHASKETLRDVEKVRSGMMFGIVPMSAEWQQRRLPIVTEEINYFLNPPQSLPTYSAPTVTAPQLTAAQAELGRRLQAAGISDVSPSRDNIRNWIHSERDEAMSQVRKFLRGRDGRIDKANEAALQSVLRGE